jgi:hypothetical protein
MGNLGVTEIIMVLIVIGLLFLLPIIAIIDIVRSKFEGNYGILMVLVVIFVPIIGSIIYFLNAPSRKLK